MTTRTLPTASALRRALNRKFDPALIESHGWTDLHYAAILNLPGLARALLRRGAAVDARLEEAAEADERLTSILAGLDVTYDSCQSETPLHLASWANAAAVAGVLLDHGADVHARLPSVSDWTPLHLATRYDAVDTAAVLISRGANVNHLDEFDSSPLHVAALYHAVATVDLLIDNGADVRTRARHGLTPLHVAAVADSPGVAARLIDHGADVNALTEHEATTPLDHAVAKRSRSTADLIRRRGGHMTVESRLDLKTVLDAKVQGQAVKMPIFEYSVVRRPKPHPYTRFFSFPTMVRDTLSGFVAKGRPPGWLDRFDLDGMVRVPVEWVPLEWRCADVMWSIPLRPDGRTSATHMIFTFKFEDTVVPDLAARLDRHLEVLGRALGRRRAYGAPGNPPLLDAVVIYTGAERWPENARFQTASGRGGRA